MKSVEFQLDSRLQRDSEWVGLLDLCQIRLIFDRRYPWFVLIPQIDGACEVHHLTEEQQRQLWDESRRLAQAMETAFEPDKMNVAALGNVVSQLHVHHIARYKDDEQWPAPVWGRGEMVPYTAEEKKAQIGKLLAALQSTE